ncbi:nicotinate-nucleotide adenylyltransferase [Aristophania vespae]|nr:nicotinate-nucleotide adenylyltransferase [Aristophania vespae]UMM64114.1 nicotinate-nucleotide adenylyltransferase [Aristophania vespae]
MINPHLKKLFKNSYLSPWGDKRRIRVGLLGGSFNPAHEGHKQIAQQALKSLQLDQVWLLVSPGNPLKSARMMAPFAQRLATAQSIADGKHIIATDIEFRLKERFTWRTVLKLKKLYPNIRFVWLMGSDGFAQFSQWKRWQYLAKIIPIAIFPRPNTIMPALRGKASSAMRRHRRVARQAATILNEKIMPCWSFLSTAQNPISSTYIRESGQFNPHHNRSKKDH